MVGAARIDLTGLVASDPRGNLLVEATGEGRLLAHTQALAIKHKTGIIPTQSAKGAAATFAANVVLGSVKALVSDSDVTANDVTVTAANSAFIDATSEVSAIGTSDTDAVSFKFILENGDLALGPRSQSTSSAGRSATSRSSR